MNDSATNLIDDLRLLEAPRPLLWLWALVPALVLLFGFFLWRRSRRRATAPSPAVIAAAREDALAELKRLRPLISVENSRRYAIEVSQVIRRYIERRFGIQAPRRSTEEFLAEAQGSPTLNTHCKEGLRAFLSGCDFLKFARATAEVPELEQIHSAAEFFVVETHEERTEIRERKTTCASERGEGSASR